MANNAIGAEIGVYKGGFGEFLLGHEGHAPDTFDWIYLDASHLYEHTLAEIRASLRVIKSGGMLTGDDYDPDPLSNQHGVFRAVNDITVEPGCSLILNRSRQWAFQVP